jgi:biopolymer transport protein ExbB/TolQ
MFNRIRGLDEMQKKTAIRFITNVAPLIGFVGTTIGMAVIFPAIERSEMSTYDLIRGVEVGLVATLALIVVILVPLVAWTQFNRHNS